MSTRRISARMIQALRVASGEGAVTWIDFAVHRVTHQFARARRLGWIDRLPQEPHHTFALYRISPAGRTVLADATKETP